VSCNLHFVSLPLCSPTQEVRLVERPSKINPGENVTICFVDFVDIVSSTEAMHALQVRRLCGL